MALALLDSYGPLPPLLSTQVAVPEHAAHSPRGRDWLLGEPAQLGGVSTPCLFTC